METSHPYRPRVSRETRLLLIAGVAALAVLWLLARIRFPDRPVTPNPVPPVLGQLAGGPKYDDLAREITQLFPRLQPSLLRLAPTSVSGARPASPPATAVRLRDDLAVMLIPSASDRNRWNETPILARDAASGVAVVRVPTPSPVPGSVLVPWTPRQFGQSRYLVASDVSSDGVSLRPVFVGWLDPVESALWPGSLWTVPGRTDLVPGSFLFTSRAELAGLVIVYGEQLAIVPGATVLEEAERLVAAPPGAAGVIGIDVQELTASLASVTGAPMGVVVTWIDATGPGKGQLMAGDVIEAIDGRALTTRQQWDVRVARLAVGETLGLRVRRRGELREVALVANAPPAPPANRSLGLALRTLPRIGAEVRRIDSGSAADRAGLILGDIITLVADVAAPTPSQIMRSYTSLNPGERVLVAVTRGDAHLVTTVER
jgi:hypothetical protein